MDKEKLAINQYKDVIIEKIQNHQAVVIEAPTGSGKTTQLPQILFSAGLNGWGTIGVTQPRRIAAFGVSKRIAYEMDVECGQLVGYKMRFDDFTSANTKIKIMTDGILLEELRTDPLLLKYSIIIVDEAHERSLNIDFIMGLLKEILVNRPDFKIVISSATINARLFSQYFNNAPIISVKTRPYPVSTQYHKLYKKGDLEEIFNTISKIIQNLEENQNKGDVLIFLTGEEAIKECCRRLEVINTQFQQSMKILSLYSRLSPEEQNRVFKDFPGKRKIIIATNIAETSITIDGIVYVIDSGLCKINYYNPRTFTSFLETKFISRASCDQRKGRAGRTAPGVVYRLYTEDDYLSRDEFTKEEIYRTDLSEVVLRMADFGIENYSNFKFISPPNRGAINSAIETLNSINALENNRITELGKKMVDFPLSPRLSRILFEALDHYSEVANKVIIIISFLSTKSPFLYPRGEEIESRSAQKKLSSKGGDFFSWLNVYYKYIRNFDKEKFCKKYYLDPRVMNEIVKIHNQLKDMVIKKDYVIKDRFDYDKIIICFAAGLKQYICKKDHKRKNNYLSCTEKDIRIHPGSFLFGEDVEWLVGGEIVNTGRTYVRTAALITEKLIKNQLADIFLQVTQKPQKKKYLREESTKVKKSESIANRIELFNKYFEVVKIKKERYVIIPYHIIIQLRQKKQKMINLDFGKIKARLFYKDKLILIDKFSSILKYFDKIDLDNGINPKWPKNQVFLYPNDWNEIFRYIKLLLKPTLRSKKNKKTGFLCLRYLGEESFEYYLESDFFSALETSFYSLEKLFDFPVAAWNEAEKSLLEKIHHKLNQLSEEMEV